jgi:PLP dependent protein
VTDIKESIDGPLQEQNSIRGRIDVVRQRIQAACHTSGRVSDEVRLIAVTKRVPIKRIWQAAALGLTDFGENYMQEAKAKIEAFEKGPPGQEPTHWHQPIQWHMIGHVQANKAKFIPGNFNYVHSIDREELLAHLDRYGKPLSVLFEVNIAGEEQKHGATESGLRTMLSKLGELKNITPVGLMTMPPWSDDPEDSRPVFASLRRLLERVNSEFGLAMKELSMGMSGDFDIAIQEGATMVRVGTAIFGDRQ